MSEITSFLNHIELLEEDKEEGVNDLVNSLNEVISDMTNQARSRQKVA
ncbi:MAG: hypothetical protein AAFY41_10285 [Bacteroidota bacterium]